MLKGLLPAGLVAMVAFFSLFTNATRSVNRLSTLTSTFIAGVLLHLNTTNVLPAVPYLTFTDGFMLGNYVVIVLSIGTAIGEIALSDGPHPLRAETVNRQARWILPLLWVLIQAVNALTLIR
jgi:hypothetical protein